SLEYLNSFATVYVDGARVGEIRFPGGDVDITAVSRAGKKQKLQLLVLAMPLKGVMLSYTDSASARQVKGTVARRGLCGDVYLTSLPSGPIISDVRIETSVRQGELTVASSVEGLEAGASYALRARLLKDNRPLRDFTSQPFRTSDLREGHYTFSEKW